MPRQCRAFTLVELLVVVGIIILVMAIAIPAVGPMLASNELSAAVNTLNGLLVSAQTAAQVNGTKVGIRFERAYATNENGVMVDANGCTPDGELSTGASCSFQGPHDLDHQQARLVIFMISNDSKFRHLPNTEAMALPKGAWVAPSNILTNDTSRSDDLYDSLLNSDLETPEYAPKRTFNRMDTFYVTFGPDGELTPSIPAHNKFLETHQSRFSDMFVPIPSHVADSSALSLLVYDRNEFNSIDKNDGPARLEYLSREARPIYINRALGSLLEERP